MAPLINRLQQVELRLVRARKHLAELEHLAEANRSIVSKSISFHRHDWTEPIYQVGNDPETLGEVETGELQVVIDEIVQNLRTALNYLVVALARFDSGKQKVARELQFPIERCEKCFLKNRTKYLKGIGAEHGTMIERVQPYNRCEW